jgi:hypothetical protein
VSLPVLMKLFGHKPPTMTLRYFEAALSRCLFSVALLRAVACGSRAPEEKEAPRPAEDLVDAAARRDAAVVS